MSHSYVKIWIHAIWTTHKRENLIQPKIENEVYQFISDQFREQNCFLKAINGMPDHVHCLFRLNKQKSIAEIIKQIKGSSSHYVNKNNLIEQKFAWQTGYAAFSISESGVDNVFKYIRNQKTYHSRKSFNEELSAFLKLYQFNNG